MCQTRRRGFASNAEVLMHSGVFLDTSYLITLATAVVSMSENETP